MNYLKHLYIILCAVFLASGIPEVSAQESQTSGELVEETVISETLAPQWGKHVYVKTNVPAWALLWINVQGEIDIDRHWSFMLPIYYSGFNYFHSTRKYRTFTVLPEFRYWFRPDNQGFFVGVHGGISYYNCSFDGQYRYQDHDKDTPAYGGGIAAGFRFAPFRNKRWKVEFSAGMGYYRLDYDKFLNIKWGPRVDRKKKNLFCLDQIALSIGYEFDLKKKGGDK